MICPPFVYISTTLLNLSSNSILASLLLSNTLKQKNIGSCVINILDNISQSGKMGDIMCRFQWISIYGLGVFQLWGKHEKYVIKNPFCPLPKLFCTIQSETPFFGIILISPVLNVSLQYICGNSILIHMAYNFSLLLHVTEADTVAKIIV